MQPPQMTWDNPKIALLSADLPGFSEEVIQRLERRHWSFPVRTGKITEAFRSITSGQCSLLIIHDSKELPASMALRSQIVDPIAIITPTIVITHPEHKSEITLIKDIGAPEIVEAPVNPAAFIGSFEWLIRRWNQGSLRKLYQARKLFIDKQFLLFSRMISSLKEEPELQPLITPCMAQILLKQSDFKTVEKLLLTGLKEHPRNIGIIVNLVEFYLRAAMPETALKIIAATRKNHGNPRMLFPDQIQAHLMLNQVKECIPLLETMIRDDYSRSQASQFLARCLYAEGFRDKFQKSVGYQVPLMEEFNQKWKMLAG